MWRKDFTVRYRDYSVTASAYVWVALGVLVVSNIVYFVAFCTDGWGILQENDGRGTWYSFGLWQQCVRPNYLCFNAGTTQSYGAARAFAVLGLFGHVFSVGLLLGYMFEKILDFDDCMIITWTSVCFATGTSVFISVVIFGARWPLDFRYPGTDTWLSYSFGMACVTVFFMMFAGAMGVMEITTFVPTGDPRAYLAHLEEEKENRRRRSERRGYRSADADVHTVQTDVEASSSGHVSINTH